MDRQLSALSKMIVEGELHAFIDAGITPEHFHDDKYRRVYEWVLGHLDRYGSVPDEDAVKRAYPVQKWVHDDPQPTQYYVDQLLTAHRHRVLWQALRDIQEAVVDADEAEQLEASVGIMQRTLDRLTATPGNSVQQPLTLQELLALPDVPSLIDGVVHQESVVFLSGAYGSYKSFLALDWALSVGTGTAWHHRDVAQGPVLYVAAEGFAGYRKRVMAWNVHQGLAASNVYMHRGLNLGNAESVSALCTHARRLGARLIVIDTLHACTSGLDENSNKDAGVVFGALQRLRDAMDGGTVLVVHHLGKDSSKGSRGASAWEADADAVYHLKREEGTTNAALQCRKMKDGSEGEAWTLQAHQVDLGNGDTSLVLQHVTAQHTNGMPSLVNHLFSVLCSHTGPMTPWLTTKQWGQAAGHDPKNLNRDVAELIDKGMVERSRQGQFTYWRPVHDPNVRTPRGPFDDPDDE